MPCTSDQFDNNNTYYLLDHPGLKWEIANVNSMNTHVGRIQVPSISAKPFMLGRIRIGNYTQIGKIRNWPDFIFRFMQDDKEVAFVSGFEVLTCTSPPPCGEFELENILLD